MCGILCTFEQDLTSALSFNNFLYGHKLNLLKILEDIMLKVNALNKCKSILCDLFYADPLSCTTVLSCKAYSAFKLQ